LHKIYSGENSLDCWCQS